MRKTLLTAAALAIGITAFAGASQAAPFNGPYPNNGPSITLQFGGPLYHQRTLSNAQIRYALLRQGYHHARILDRGPFRVTVRAEDFRGRDFRLVVNARTGFVISRVALYQPRPFPFPGKPFYPHPYNG